MTVDDTSNAPVAALADGRYQLLRPVGPEDPPGAWVVLEQERRSLLVLDASALEGEARSAASWVLHVEPAAQRGEGECPYVVTLQPVPVDEEPQESQAARRELERVSALLAGKAGTRQGGSTRAASPADDGALGPLLERLDDPDPEERCHAADALGRAGSPGAVGPLIATLEDSDPDVRRYAAAALGELGDERAIGPLTQRLGDEDSWVVEWSAGALHRLGHSPRGAGYRGAYSYFDDEGEEQTVAAEDE